MLNPGEDNILEIVRMERDKVVLADDEGKEILLPKRQKPKDVEIGDHLNVFIYPNAEGILIATTREPTIKLGKFGFLKVVQTSQHGAFLDWGLDKDVFVPFSEQATEMIEGMRYLIYLYKDLKSNRLAGSSKINKFLENDSVQLAPGEEVEIIVAKGGDLGVNVIVNNRHWGLIYYNEIFEKINTGDKRTAYVKQIREDNKLDISLQKQGYENVEPNARKILEMLNQEDGFLPLNDKSAPEDIQRMLEMSKKTFKKSIGSLYKQRIIRIEAGGIFLNEEESDEDDE